MGQVHDINALEAVYDELSKTNPHGAANFGVVIDRLEDNLGLSPEHNKILSLYIEGVNWVQTTHRLSDDSNRFLKPMTIC